MRGYARKLALGVIAISLILSQGSAQQAGAQYAVWRVGPLIFP
jgi:hypothetical protein